ncbi:MAG: CPBP family intramembrane metalloprotease [Acholeplasmataceae bacterium]|nr:MAG: CPBP family intramembrane metalloprotease [Acholeplasmataceae bacterium]
MESNVTLQRQQVKKSLMVIVFLVLLVSIIPEILFSELTGAIPGWLHHVRLAALVFIAIVLQFVAPFKHLTTFVVLLIAISFGHILINLVVSIESWSDVFPKHTFVGSFGGNIILKIIQVIPVTVALLVLFKGPKEAYLAKGDLTVKVEEIKWLGIRKHRFSWGRLAVISGLLISLGTILLTIITVTGASVQPDFSRLPVLFPLILALALFNSLCEGIVYRSTVLSSLTNILPKNHLMLVAAALFGIAHFYGAPGGIIGVVMSGLLGWYMCRSMYETKGFASSWIIHFMQDVVIFSTILVLGNFS